MVEDGLIEPDSCEYYGIWTMETEALLRDAKESANMVQLSFALVTTAYSIYNIIASISAIKMTNNSTTIVSSSYKNSVANIENLFSELDDVGAKYTKENTIWITKNSNGKIVWLETGNAGAGFTHILEHHPINQFTSYFGVTSESQLSALLYNTITTQSPTQIIGIDQYVYTINGNPLSIIIGGNGFVVTAHPGI